MLASDESPVDALRHPRSRRSAMLGMAAVAAGAALPVATASHAAAAPASGRAVTRKAQQGARGAFAVPAQHDVPLPDARTRHLLSRFTGGVTAQRIADVAKAGGIDGWFEQQLAPDQIGDHQADALWSWFPVLALTPQQKWRRYLLGEQTSKSMMADLASWIMMRRLVSNRALQELMVDFWSNQLHVASPDVHAWPWRTEYEATIRAHCLGRFNDLLLAAIESPAMNAYSLNYRSTGDAPVPILGRALLECHTVGLGVGTELDIIEAALILTGFYIDTIDTLTMTYVPSRHYVGEVRVLDFRSANTNPDGRPVLRELLSYLAHHPVTARRVCTALAVRFSSDSPSPALIDSLVKVYLDSDTEIVPVLRALVASQEFQSSALRKVRTPVEDTIASYSVLGATIHKPRQPLDTANHLITVSGAAGQVVYDWATPDGFPDLGPAWTCSGRLVGAMRAHWWIASGPLPNEGITYRDPLDWLPPLPAEFADIIDHLARSVWFLPLTTTMLQAACVVTGHRPTDIITPSDPVATYQFPLLLCTVLDTPQHLSR